MNAMAEQDHIGPDPIVWVERLMEVAKSSQFSGQQKALIDNSLFELRMALIRTALSAGKQDGG
jgi:hypothetical protein